MTWSLSSSHPPGLTWQQGAVCALLLGAIGFGGWRLIEHRQQEQRHQSTLATVEKLKADRDYKACEAEAKRIPTHSQFHRQAQNRMQECAAIQAVFNQANKFADSGRFDLAIAAVIEIADPTAMPQVTQSIRDWSEQTLQKAQQTYQDRNGRLQEALEIAGWIKSDNPLYPQAQDNMQAWTDQWSRNEACWNRAKDALTARQFDIALAQIQQIDHPYWQQQALPIGSAISVYTSLLAALPSPQPSSSAASSTSNANSDTSGYTNALFQDLPSGQPISPASGDASGDAASDAGDYGSSGNWSGQLGPDVASLTLKFLIPLSVPLMLGLGRARN